MSHRNRIRVRPLMSFDFDAVTDLLSNPEVMTYIGPKHPLSHNEISDWFNDYMNAQDNNRVSRHPIVLRHSNELIGFCGVKEKNNRYDFGFYFRRKFWGRGYALEACQLIYPKARECYGKKLEIFIASDNMASLKLAKRMGWRPCSNGVMDSLSGIYFH